jgi:hypothetical protein
VADDPDHLAGHIEHGSAGVALIDRGISLKQFCALHAAESRVVAPACAHMPDGQRVLDPERGADDEDLVPDVRLVGVPQGRNSRATRY